MNRARRLPAPVTYRFCPSCCGRRMGERIIKRLFPMFHLSVDGLTQAMQALVGAKAQHA